MKVNAEVWQALEQRGLTAGHLELLLHLLELHKNGSWNWHFANGTLCQSDLRIVFSNRPYDLQHVAEVVGGNAIRQEP